MSVSEPEQQFALNFVAAIGQRPIAFHRWTVTITNSITAGLFLCQAIYWADRGHDANGWFYKIVADWEHETGLSYEEQKTARRKLCSLGILKEMQKGIPKKLWFKIDFVVLKQLFEEKVLNNPQCRGKPNSRVGESPDTDKGKAKIQSTGIPCTNTEITAEITHKLQQPNMNDESNLKWPINIHPETISKISRVITSLEISEAQKVLDELAFRMLNKKQELQIIDPVKWVSGVLKNGLTQTEGGMNITKARQKKVVQIYHQQEIQKNNTNPEASEAGLGMLPKNARKYALEAQSRLNSATI